MVMRPFYSMLPVNNTFMYLAIMYQPVEDGSYKASMIYLCYVHPIINSGNGYYDRRTDEGPTDHKLIAHRDRSSYSILYRST